MYFQHQHIKTIQKHKKINFKNFKFLKNIILNTIRQLRTSGDHQGRMKKNLKDNNELHRFISNQGMTVRTTTRHHQRHIPHRHNFQFPALPCAVAYAFTTWLNTNEKEFQKRRRQITDQSPIYVRISISVHNLQHLANFFPSLF